MNIRNLLKLAVMLLLPVTSACDKDEQIEPVAPTEKKTEPAAEVVVQSVSVTSYDSAIYRHAAFDGMPFRILFPKNYDSTQSYPLLIFLHGISERGSDNLQQLKWGASLFQRDSVREAYRSFVVFPQCPVDGYWFDRTQTERLKGLIQTLVEDYGVDEQHIAIGGLSMGAYGTYAMVARYGNLFSSAVAISGDGDEDKSSVMASARWRIFAGEKDQIVPSSKSEKMASALRGSGASVSFTVYPDADHTGSWVKAFAEPDFCSWIFGRTQTASLVQ